MNNDQVKVCTKCNISKPLSEFVKRPNTNNYYGTCKECKKEYAKKYREEKAEQISIRRKKHYEENKEELRAIGRRYYEEHKEEVNARSKEYYNKNAKELNKKSRAYYKEHSEEIREQKKIYNEEHKEQYKEWRKGYYEENKQSIYEYQKQYRQDNQDLIKDYMKQYREENKEEIKEKRKQYYQDNKEIINAKNKIYVAEHIEERREYRERYRKARIEKDPLFKMTTNIRHLINNCFRRQGFTKKAKTYDILKCDYETLYNHLLQTYKDNYGVEWDGKEEVHIDHIIPIATATNEEEVIALCYYKNLQLLKARDNLIKHDRLDFKLPSVSDEEEA